MSHNYILSSSELFEIEASIQDMRVGIQNDVDLYTKAKLASLKLPLKLRENLIQLRFESSTPYCVISGFSINDLTIGNTPISNQSDDKHDISREDILLTMLASQLGIPFSFATQQKGRLVQTIVPVKDKEYSQLGVGSREELVWHTEDGFHPNRPDFILLMCMRNHDKVPTTVGELPNNLSVEEIELLFSENFYLLPDPDHASHLKNWKTDEQRIAFEQMRKYVESPQSQSILYGSRSKPFMRLDPKFTSIASDQHPSVTAYHKLITTMDEQLKNIALKPGEILIIDNHRAVHGRRSFTPKYDGTDRWLKKINVTLDARKSSGSRFYSEKFIVA